MELTLEEFIFKYSDYARVIASKFINEVKDYGIDFDDLYQTGCLALVECYHRYDKQKASYSAFAYNNIYYAVLKYINNNCYITHVPGDINYLARYLRKKEASFYLESGRNMTLNEVFEILNQTSYADKLIMDESFVLLLEKVSMFQYRKQFYYGNDCTENYDLYNGEIVDSVPFDELIISAENVEDIAIKNILISEVIECLYEFDIDKRNEFIDFVGLNDGVWKSLKEIGLKYNVSHQTVDNHYKKILRKIQIKLK